ncbi:type IV secretion system protein [Paraburkholderia youngii]|uniref:type IV secretion system protein n=1 Tax=Paraburkholderia youngii TaxID=2782701 RepID=UPI003D1E8A37
MKLTAARTWALRFLIVVVALASLLGLARTALAQDASIDPTTTEVQSAQNVDANAAAPANAGCSAVKGWSADADTFSGITGTLLSPFSAADSTIFTTANSYAGSVMRNALTLGGILATTYIMWSILRFLADGGGNYTALVIDSMVPVAMVAGVLANYTPIVTDLQSLFNSMIPSQGGVSHQIAQLAQGFMSGIGTALKAEWNSLGCAGSSGVAVLLHAFCVAFLMIIAALLAIVALAEIVGVLLTGSVLMGVGIAVGPYFIAAGVCRWSYDYMMKWLNFLMGALFYKSLISIVLYLVNGCVKTVVDNVTNYNAASGTGFPLGNAVALIGVMWILKHVFQSIPGIASALIGGSGGHAPSLNKAIDSAVKTGSKANRAFNAYNEAKAERVIKEEKAKQAEAARNAAGSAGPSAATSGPSFNPASAATGTSAASNGGFAGNPVNVSWTQGAGAGMFSAAAAGASAAGNSPNYSGGSTGFSPSASPQGSDSAGAAATAGAADVSRGTSAGQTAPSFSGRGGDVSDVDFRESGSGQTGGAGGGGFQVD